MTPQFEPGDRVRVRSARGGRQRSVWVVVGEDTNQTPVHDPEPAYQLLLAGSTVYKQHTRYAYESTLELVA